MMRTGKLPKAARPETVAVLAAAFVVGGSPALAQSQTSSASSTPVAATVDAVVVTATGRRAALQDVPMAVTAVGADTARNAGISDLKVLQDVAPTYHLIIGQSAASSAYASIRGINTGGDNPGFESAVGFFIDGVYRNRTGVALSEMPEIDRIEVLAGPQGALFGRNTTAGAVSVTTKAPEFTPRGFLYLTAGNLNDRKAVFGVTGPLTAGDILAGKLEGSYETRDGYITDIASGRKFNNRDRWMLRGQLLWNLNSDASLRLIADTANTDEQCCYAVSSRLGPTAAALDLLAGLSGLPPLPTPDPSARRSVASPGRDLLERVHEWGLSGQLDWNLSGVKLTAITAYRDWRLQRDQIIDFSDVDRAYRDGYADEFRTFTEEVRLNGAKGPLNWLVGGFYADEILDHTDNIKVGAQAAEYVDALAGGALPGYNIYGSLGQTGCGAAQALFPGCRLLAAGIFQAGRTGNPAHDAALLGLANAFANAVAATAPLSGQGQDNDRFSTHTRTAALFTHDELALSDRVTWTLGLRFNHEDKDLTANLPPTTGTACGVYQGAYSSLAQAAFNSPLQPFFLLTCNPVVNSVANGAYATGQSENELTGTTAIQFKPSREVMLYAEYSRGYKAGGYNLDRSGFNITPVSTAKPQASELHFAPEFVDAYEVGVKSTLFGGKAAVDANAFYELFSNYQDLAFSGFAFLAKNVKQVVSRGVEVDVDVRPTQNLSLQAGLLFDEAYFNSTTNFNPTGLNLPTDYVMAGETLPGASKWTLTAALTYRHMIPQTNLEGLLFLDGRFVSGYDTQTLGRDPLGTTDQGAFGVINGRVGVGPPGGHWTLELFVRNLFNTYYTIYGFGVAEQTGTYNVYPSEPRTFGTTLKLAF
jgi:outer membrane receptor protein involved in Fe transport